MISDAIKYDLPPGREQLLLLDGIKIFIDHITTRTS